MKITGIKKVQGMTTFFDYDKFPKHILNSFNLLKSNEDEHLKNAVINQFSEFAGSYIKSITSQIEGIYR